MRIVQFSGKEDGNQSLRLLEGRRLVMVDYLGEQKFPAVRRGEGTSAWESRGKGRAASNPKGALSSAGESHLFTR